jgi:hypothetical protein
MFHTALRRSSLMPTIPVPRTRWRAIQTAPATGSLPTLKALGAVSEVFR